MLIDEVVVVGYGTVRKSDLTGSVGKVTTSELNQLSTTDIGQAIAGQCSRCRRNQQFRSTGCRN